MTPEQRRELDRIAAILRQMHLGDTALQIEVQNMARRLESIAQSQDRDSTLDFEVD